MEENYKSRESLENKENILPVEKLSSISDKFDKLSMSLSDKDKDNNNKLSEYTYSNEKLLENKILKIKEELYNIINKNQKDLIVLKNKIYEETADKINPIKTKLSELNYKITDFSKTMLNSLAIEKINKMDIIVKDQDDLQNEIFNQKNQIITLSNKLESNINKYDKIYLENLFIDGIIGQNCKYNNMREFVEYVLSICTHFNSYKDKMEIELKSNKHYIESNKKQLESYIALEVKNIKDWFSKTLEINYHKCYDDISDFNQKINDVKIENGSYHLQALKSSQELKLQLVEVNEFKEELKEKNKEISKLKEKVNEIYSQIKRKTSGINNNNSINNNNNNNSNSNNNNDSINNIQKSAVTFEENSFHNTGSQLKRKSTLSNFVEKEKRPIIKRSNSFLDPKKVKRFQKSVDSNENHSPKSHIIMYEEEPQQIHEENNKNNSQSYIDFNYVDPKKKISKFNLDVLKTLDQDIGMNTNNKINNANNFNNFNNIKNANNIANNIANDNLNNSFISIDVNKKLSNNSLEINNKISNISLFKKEDLLILQEYQIKTVNNFTIENETERRHDPQLTNTNKNNTSNNKEVMKNKVITNAINNKNSSNNKTRNERIPRNERYNGEEVNKGHEGNYLKYKSANNTVRNNYSNTDVKYKDSYKEKISYDNDKLNPLEEENHDVIIKNAEINFPYETFYKSEVKVDSDITQRPQTSSSKFQSLSTSKLYDKNRKSIRNENISISATKRYDISPDLKVENNTNTPNIHNNFNIKNNPNTDLYTTNYANNSNNLTNLNSRNKNKNSISVINNYKEKDYILLDKQIDRTTEKPKLKTIKELLDINSNSKITVKVEKKRTIDKDIKVNILQNDTSLTLTSLTVEPKNSISQTFLQTYSQNHINSSTLISNSNNISNNTLNGNSNINNTNNNYDKSRNKPNNINTSVQTQNLSKTLNNGLSDKVYNQQSRSVNRINEKIIINNNYKSRLKLNTSNIPKLNKINDPFSNIVTLSRENEYKDTRRSTTLSEDKGYKKIVFSKIRVVKDKYS